jgi:hypothetical protein
MDAFDIRVQVYKVFCFHGADEETSEPYLWVIGFKFDGSTLRQQLTKLVWTPDFFFSGGSHGNIGGGMDPGTSSTVPGGVGTWNTSLAPIELTDIQGNTTQIPGTVGFAAVLLEENSVADHAAEAGHQALNGFVAERIQAFVDSIDLTEVNSAVQTKVDQGTARDQAVQEVLQPRLDALQQQIGDGASDVVSNAIRADLNIPESVFAGLDKDQMMGKVFHRVTAPQLIGANNFIVDFDDDIFDNPAVPEAGNFAYTLHSYVKAKVKWESIASQLPAAHDIQIQGIEHGFSHDLGKSYISNVGGVVDGKPWWLSRSEAAEFIDRGDRAFFLMTADGQHTPVLVESPRGSHWSYLTTPPDDRPENNLLALPNLSDVPGFFRAVLAPDPFA